MNGNKSDNCLHTVKENWKSRGKVEHNVSMPLSQLGLPGDISILWFESISINFATMNTIGAFREDCLPIKYIFSCTNEVTRDFQRIFKDFQEVVPSDRGGYTYAAGQWLYSFLRERSGKGCIAQWWCLCLTSQTILESIKASTFSLWQKGQEEV